MEVHLYTLCWNDADMLPFFFRHYDRFVSRYFFFDDRSSDSSPELIHGHPNAEMKPLIRSDPTSFTLSELSISNECWKRSRGEADWVIVIDIDEHLYHPNLAALLTRYKALGITIVPALGYQMLSEQFPRPEDGLLSETLVRGAAWDIYSKLAVFDPSAISEVDYGVGRHRASPTGRVVAPCHDELLLLHYKFLGFERTHARHQQRRHGLRTKDIENSWGYQYTWSEEEFRDTWQEFSRKAVDVRADAAITTYLTPRWWDPFRSLATEPRAHTPSLDLRTEHESIQRRYPVAGQTAVSEILPAISPASFWVPEYICPSAWIEHAPFAFWVCEALRPRCFVELGTQFAYSYFAFCQAIDRLGLGTTAYAIDTWKGDEHTGFYDEGVFRSVATHNNDKYAAFSCLIRSTFKGALDYFPDGSIDLIHIDGRHFYDDVKEDYTLWRAKLTENAVVLFHDTNVRERDFGVWKFFESLAAQHPSFQFFHGYGLGVLIPGDRVPAPLTPLLEASRETAHQIRAAYAALGGALTVRAALGEPHREIEDQSAERSKLLGEVESLKALIATIASEREEALNVLNERQREIEAQHTTQVQLLGEIENLNALIATITGKHDDAVAALSAESVALASSRAALASTDEKLEKLDGALSRAKRELADRNAAVEALEFEITTLRSSLAAARDVGRAAFVALQTEPVTLPWAPSDAGWLASVMRPLGFRGRTRLGLPKSFVMRGRVW
jgi:hypothetical protein